MVLMHPELSCVEGYLVLTDHDGQEYRVAHSWNETPDGQLVDSIAWALEGQVQPIRYERDPEAWARLAVIAEDLAARRSRFPHNNPKENPMAAGDTQITITWNMRCITRAAARLWSL
jgi:hypothetical protein